jgi:hypothetical protein
MEALKETTNWGPGTKNNTYLLDGTNLIAYIPHGGQPYQFKNPIKGFDKRGRTFEKVDIELFPNRTHYAQVINSAMIKMNDYFDSRKVTGSKGEIYTVNDKEGTCTCPGYTYRGACKHVKELESV